MHYDEQYEQDIRQSWNYEPRKTHQPLDSYEHQYLNILRCCLNGQVVKNSRTGVDCYTSLNHQIRFNGVDFPILTTRKVYWKNAINEMLCYIRGYTTLDQFHSLGVKTWDANANAWNSPLNPNKDWVGIIYGASAERTGVSYWDIVEQIKKNPSDRGIIWSFWNPGYFSQGCLRPCMFNHQFNVINGVLHLTSTQRSADVALGTVFNAIQCWFLINLTAHLTGLRVGTVCLNMTNCHIYQNQVPQVQELLSRTPLSIQDTNVLGICRLTDQDIKTGSVTDKLNLVNYRHLDPIKFEFTA